VVADGVTVMIGANNGSTKVIVVVNNSVTITFDIGVEVGGNSAVVTVTSVIDVSTDIYP